MKIPQEHLDFIKGLVEQAKKAGYSTFSGELRPGFYHSRDGSEAVRNFHETIKFHWSRGRHDEPARLMVESIQTEWLEV